MALPPPRIDQAAQRFEESGHVLNFIEDDESIHERREIQCRFGELGAIFTLLKVDVDRGRLSSDGECERGFADLAGAKQHHCRLDSKVADDPLEEATFNHCCILNGTR